MINIDLNDFSYDFSLPAVLVLDNEIEPNAMRLYAFIKGLTRAHGYCYATNEYLAALTGGCERSVRNWLDSLRKKGYVEIETSKKGIQWQRRIYISDKFKKSLRKAMDCHPAVESEENQKKFTKGNGLPHPRQMVAAISKVVKEEVREKEIKEKGAAAPNPASSSLFSFFLEELKKHIPEVLNMPATTTAKAFDKLLENRPDEEIRRVITFAMQDEFWRQHVHSPTYLKAKYEKILTKMNASKAKTGTQTANIQTETENRTWWTETQHVANRQRRYPSGCRLEVLDQGIIIHNGRDKEAIKFSDVAFQKIIKATLHNWGFK